MEEIKELSKAGGPGKNLKIAQEVIGDRQAEGMVEASQVTPPTGPVDALKLTEEVQKAGATYKDRDELGDDPLISGLYNNFLDQKVDTLATQELGRSDKVQPVGGLDPTNPLKRA